MGFCVTFFHLCSDLGHCYLALISETINRVLCAIKVGVKNIDEIRGPEGKKGIRKVGDATVMRNVGKQTNPWEGMGWGGKGHIFLLKFNPNPVTHEVNLSSVSF